MKYLFLLSCSFVAAAPALAQDAVAVETGVDETLVCTGPCMTQMPRPDAQTIMVTGQPTNIYANGRSISIVGRAELDRVQGPDLARVLERLPGVTLARSGPLGSQTSLFVRGASSDQVVVTIDGVRMQDLAAPSGGFDFGTLLTGGIGKIELLRGSNSVAFGSDAIGGVLAVSTVGLDGVAASAEYGAHQTFSGDAALGKTGEGYALTATSGYTRSDGISAFSGGTEPDGFRQWHAGLAGRVDLTGSLQASLTGRYADSKIDFDGYPFPAYVFADTPEYQTTRQASGRAAVRYSDNGLELQAGLALSDTRRSYFDPTYGTASGFDTTGRSWRVDFSSSADLTDGISVDFGADSEWTRFSTTFDPEQTARQSAGFALLRLERGRLRLNGGARLTEHDRFGSNWTLGANASFALGEGWRLRASYGEGFKAPSLSQLYGYGGNVLLQPETSTAWDAGLELDDRNGGAHAAFTLFRRDSTNLIDYVSPTGYFNVGRTRAEGFELEGGARIAERLTVRAAYTYLSASNHVTGKQLARRPRHALSASLDWRTPLRDLSVGADLRLVGDSFDDAGNFTAIDGHALLTLRASVPLGQQFELYGRIENVTDARYETVAGYGTYGRSAYAGVRLKW